MHFLCDFQVQCDSSEVGHGIPEREVLSRDFSLPSADAILRQRSRHEAESQASNQKQTPISLRTSSRALPRSLPRPAVIHYLVHDHKIEIFDNNLMTLGGEVAPKINNICGKCLLISPFSPRHRCEAPLIFNVIYPKNKIKMHPMRANKLFDI